MEDPDPTVEEHLAAWADVLSFILLGIAIIIAGGIDPRRRIWGRSPLRNALLIIFLTINIVYSTGRFIAEGVLVETGPREFLLLSVVYCSRWIWLFVTVFTLDSKSAKAFHVARALRKLKTIRLGTSTRGPSAPKKQSRLSKLLCKAWGVQQSNGPRDPGRRGDKELVIRSGARNPSGEPYWRGVEDKVLFHEDEATHEVRLLQKELYSDHLDKIGTIGFKREIETDSPDNLYKKFYDLVMAIDIKNPELVVDYAPFLGRFDGVGANSRQPQMVNATDESELGSVARRVAADACFYIFQSSPDLQLRTNDQVEVINQCLESAVSTYFRGTSNV